MKPLPLGSSTTVFDHPSKAGTITNIHKYIMSGSVNYEKVVHIYLLLIVSLCLKHVYAFLLLFLLLIVTPCSDMLSL